MSIPENFRFDLSTALIADSGTRIMLDGGDTWISCSIDTKLSKSGVRFVRFAVQNFSRRGIICIPAAGSGLKLHSVGHRTVSLDRSEHRAFEVRFPSRVNTIGLFIQASGEQCVFILPVSRPAVTLETGLGLLAFGLACGVVGGVVSARYGWPPKLEFSGIFTPRPPRSSAPEPPPRQTPEPQAAPAPEPPPEPAQPSEPPASSPAAGVPYVEPGGNGAAGITSTPVSLDPPDAPAPDAARSVVRYAEAIIEEPRSSLAFAGNDGSIIGTIEMLDRTLHAANYVVKVVNETPDPLICTWQGVRGRSASALEPSSFRIEPMAASAVTLSVPLRVFSPFERAFVNLRSRHVSCTLETHVPESRLYPALKALVSAILLLLVFAAMYSVAVPRINAYAVPATALAGSNVRSAYVVSGFGEASYEVFLGSTRVASGMLPSGSGYFTFGTGNKAASYRAVLAVRGALGSQTQTRVVNVLPIARAGGDIAQALIGTFEVQNATVKSGEPIVVRYAGSASMGTVRLLDAAQIAVAQVPYTTSGTSTIVAPNVTTATPYRLELNARSGKSAQSVSTGVLVEPASAALPGEKGGQGHLISAKELLRIDPPYVRGNAIARVVLLQNPPGLTLSLQDARGVPVRWREVARDSHSVSYAVPRAFSEEHFVIVATFKQGSGDQIVLAPFVVHAH